MKVKVRGKIYDGTKEPVMVILSEKDKENIRNMSPGGRKYCVYPNIVSPSDVERFMRTEGC